MSEKIDQPTQSGAGDWLKKRDRWMREVMASSFLDRNAKLAGIYLALRVSHKRPYTYPSMDTMGRELGVSSRQVARAIAKLVEEEFLSRELRPGRVSYYRLIL